MYVRLDSVMSRGAVQSLTLRSLASRHLQKHMYALLFPDIKNIVNQGICATSEQFLWDKNNIFKEECILLPAIQAGALNLVKKNLRIDVIVAEEAARSSGRYPW